MPTIRSSLCSGVVGGRIHAIGGGASGRALSTVEAYDPASDRWASGPAMPMARWGLSCDALGGKIYAIGGAFQTTPPHPGTREIQVYDPDA